jgi:hypothetical protein
MKTDTQSNNRKDEEEKQTKTNNLSNLAGSFFLHESNVNIENSLSQC